MQLIQQAVDPIEIHLLIGAECQIQQGLVASIGIVTPLSICLICIILYRINIDIAKAIGSRVKRIYCGPLILRCVTVACCKQKQKTSYNNTEALNNYISSSDSLQALKNLMEELGLEFEDAEIL